MTNSKTTEAAEKAALVSSGHEPAMSAQARSPAEVLPRHKFWGAGEPDCPQDLKASNGELHSTRCKVCGDGWRKSVDVCFAAMPSPPTLEDAYAEGRADE